MQLCPYFTVATFAGRIVFFLNYSSLAERESIHTNLHAVWGDEELTVAWAVLFCPREILLQALTGMSNISSLFLFAKSFL